MAIRENKYANPSLGTAFESIASLFAPTSAQDLAGYAAADHTRQQAARVAQEIGLVDMFTGGEGLSPEALDRIGVGAGLYTPNQSFGAVNMADGTARYGIDRTYDASRENNAADNARAIEAARIADETARFGHTLSYKASTENNVLDNETASQDNQLDHISALYGHDTTRANNAADNERAVQTTILNNMLGVVGEDQLRPGVNQDFLNQFGLGTLGAQEPFAGPTSPLSSDEVEAQAIQDRIAADPEFGPLLAGSSVGEPIAIVGEDGVKRYATNADAVGAAVPTETGDVKMVNVQLPDGTTGTALQTAQGLVDPETRLPLPAGTTMFSSNVQGGREDVLTTSTSSSTEQRLLDLQSAEGTTQSLRSLITQYPGLLGAPGTFQSFAQNALASIGEVGQKFGGDIENVANMAREEALRAGDGDLINAFDPNLPAVEMLSNILAFQYAKIMTGERLSNEMLTQARKALGLDRWMSNTQDAVARLDQVMQMIDSQRSSIMALRQNGAESLGGAPPAQPGSGVGTFTAGEPGVLIYNPAQ